MSYEVLILDMYHYRDEEDYCVGPFPTREMPVEFARRRVRSVVEELRKPGITPEKLREQFFMFGEDSVVVGDEPRYAGCDELDFFIAHPATAPEETGWQAIKSQAGAKAHR